MMKLSTIAILLTACSAGDARDVYCGESFCISGVSSRDVVKTTPVEDFNLYRIRFRDRDFTIYEGNQPNISGNLVRNVPIGMKDVRAELFRSGERLLSESCLEPSKCWETCSGLPIWPSMRHARIPQIAALSSSQIG